MSAYFTVFVPEAENKLLDTGNYVIMHVPTQRLLTHHGTGELVTFEKGNAESPLDEQVWFVNRRTTAKYALISLPDSFAISSAMKLSTTTNYTFNLSPAAGSNRIALSTGYTTRNYWIVDSTGSISTKQTSTLTDFPFELVPVSEETDIRQIANEKSSTGKYYDLSGRCVSVPSAMRPLLPKGIYIVGSRKVVVK